mmetsp:Transcript_49993/g.117539  ORF Transcript_49993/g.117539 Transcript_49993/m.117539 type:complete len:96 (-) Transcript_49993:1185-1472(-)
MATTLWFPSLFPRLTEEHWCPKPIANEEAELIRGEQLWEQLLLSIRCSGDDRNGLEAGASNEDDAEDDDMEGEEEDTEDDNFEGDSADESGEEWV